MSKLTWYTKCFSLLWLGLVPASLAAGPFTTFTTKEGLVNNSVKALAVDGSKLWIGTGAGLCVFDPDSQKFTPMGKNGGPGSAAITCLLTGPDKIWCGTEQGLWVYDKQNGSFRSYGTQDGLADPVVTALCLAKGDLWVGTPKGISLFKYSQNKWRTFTDQDGLSNSFIKAIASDGEEILVGTVGANINRYLPQRDRWTLFNSESLMYTNIVLSIEGDRIWSGTNGGGLRVFDRATTMWTMYQNKDGLKDDFLQALAHDGRYLWAGTFDGVSRYDTHDHSWRSYSVEDGLVDGSVTAIAIQGNYVWFGTDNGLARLDKEIPQVELTLPTRFVTNVDQPLMITGFVSSSVAMGKVEVSYSSLNLPDLWMTKGLTMTSNADGSLSVIWDPKSLVNLNDYYHIRLTAEDSQGRSNETVASIKVDTLVPALAFTKAPEESGVGMQTIQGTYNKSNIESIVLDPGSIKASLNPQTRTFSAFMNLKEGPNNIKAKITDEAGRIAEVEETIFASIQSGALNNIQVKQDKEGSRLTLSEKMLFDSGKTDLKSGAFGSLDKIASLLSEYPQVKIRIEGYTDNVPPASTSAYKNNLELSEARAKSVYYYLIEKGKIAPERMIIKGFGEKKPLASNSNEEGRAQNRRVEILIESQ